MCDIKSIKKVKVLDKVIFGNVDIGIITSADIEFNKVLNNLEAFIVDNIDLSYIYTYCDETKLQYYFGSLEGLNVCLVQSLSTGNMSGGGAFFTIENLLKISKPQLILMLGVCYLKSEDFSPSQITEYLIDKLHEENFSNPIVNSAEDFLEMLQARMQNKDFIKINKKSNIELELEANFDSEKFLKIVFKIGGFYFDKNKISVYENFPGCIAPSGVLSAELEILKTTYFKIDNYCLFENKYKEPTLTMSVPEFTNALATRFEGIKNL